MEQQSSKENLFTWSVHKPTNKHLQKNLMVGLNKDQKESNLRKHKLMLRPVSHDQTVIARLERKKVPDSDPA